MTDRPYQNRHWTSEDGLTLHFRDYTGVEAAQDRPPVLCLHGLTRNARDFSHLAERLAPEWRVLVPEMRGRGDSNYAPDPQTYAVPQYVADLTALLEQEKIDRYVAIATSMGGIMTMAQAAQDASRIAAAALNDIGPVVEPEGLEKIRTYVGQGRSFPTWMHAARSLADTHGEAHPAFALDDWLAMAKRNLVIGSNGRIVFDYDMKLAEPMLEADDSAVPPDLWPGFDALSDRPLLLIRGALSNLLSEETFAEMQRRASDVEAITIDNTGHAPTLMEPEVLAAIDRLLAKVR
ncbi:alpha/beta fold hydrolase [Qipengyuania atrilutea]|uniref:Alpha/beta hydrolase n=1 Tax=Qipengyuania atrilutea TaxID=2744473 RepID=A0A850H4J9_9SPHN|nr:alpha/beta hydrolase [Actirhodobacter atriluteus]NVD45576.1 alpha/beta hydrolase [Actirhodobacter atriluteus]